MRSMGVEAVRATVLWRIVAEGADLTNEEIEAHQGREEPRARPAPSGPLRGPTIRARTRPATGIATTTSSRRPTKLGMRVYFTITGPGPGYAHQVAPPSQRKNGGTYKPYPSRYRSFVEAVGKRYSGRLQRRERDPPASLPRVSLWSMWNEPNQPGWLSPQWEKATACNGARRAGALSRAAPCRRPGPRAHRPRQRRDPPRRDRAAGLGQTGPRDAIRPVPFLREMLCVKPDGTAVRRAPTRRAARQDFVKNPTLKATAFAHHPYTKKVAPTVAPKHPDEITIAQHRHARAGARHARRRSRAARSRPTCRSS